MKFNDRLKKALLEELQGKPAAGDPKMESPDGKGVADKKEETVKVSEKTTKTEIDLDGKNDCVDKNIPKKAPTDGGAASGDPKMESPDGTGVADKTVKKDNGTGAAPSNSGAAEGDASMGSPEGKGVATQKVKKVAESFILPHDVMVEQDGKVVTLKKGTRVGLLAEEAPAFLNKEGEEGEEEEEDGEGEGAGEGAGEEAGEEAGEFEVSDFPVDGPAVKPEDLSPIDKIVSGMEMATDGFREFGAEEKTEPAHQKKEEAPVEIPPVEIPADDIPRE